MIGLCRLLGVVALVLATAVAQAAPPPALKPGEHWLVLASRQDLADATNLARTFGRDLTEVHVVLARNGWHAVIAGPYAGRNKAEIEARLPDTVNVPADAYLGSGEGFQDLVFTAPKPPVTLTIRYDGKAQETRQVGPLTIVLDSTAAGRGMRVARMTGRSGSRVLFSTSYTDYPSPTPDAVARVVRLDPATPNPQIVFTMYTGGAHCCSATRIATEDRSGKWVIRSAESVDGMGYGLEDVDNDGHVELVDVDNAFLYAFASYAESWAPPVVYRLSGGQLREVTKEASIRPYLRRQLREMDLAASASPALWTNKGFLAGWVGAKARLGQVEEAWPRVTALLDRPDLFSAEVCAIRKPMRDCPADQRRPATFAEALRAHLAHHDYPVPRGGTP